MKKFIVISIVLVVSINLFSQVKHIEIGITQNQLENCITNVENTFEKDVIKIFPNPCQGLINIELSDNTLSDQLSVSIINLQGKTIYNENEFQSFIDISKHPKGLYIIKISSSENTFVAEIFKK